MNYLREFLWTVAVVLCIGLGVGCVIVIAMLVHYVEVCG